MDPKGEGMKTAVGLWIDHRQARIVAVTNNGEEIGMIISKAKNSFAGREVIV
jgi:hypothetical protein